MEKDLGFFQITFTDFTTFNGFLFNKDWRNIPKDKDIISILFTFGGFKIKLQHYEEYDLNTLKIATMGSSAITKEVTLIGRASNKSEGYRFDFTTGKVHFCQFEKYKEYGNLTSETWKKGIVSDSPGHSSENI